MTARVLGKWLLVIYAKCMQEVVSVCPLTLLFVSESKCVLIKYLIEAYGKIGMNLIHDLVDLI
jgi:hypothetical protein